MGLRHNLGRRCTVSNPRQDFESSPKLPKGSLLNCFWAEGPFSAHLPLWVHRAVTRLATGRDYPYLGMTRYAQTQELGTQGNLRNVFLATICCAIHRCTQRQTTTIMMARAAIRCPRYFAITSSCYREIQANMVRISMHSSCLCLLLRVNAVYRRSLFEPYICRRFNSDN